MPRRQPELRLRLIAALKADDPAAVAELLARGADDPKLRARSAPEAHFIEVADALMLAAHLGAERCVDTLLPVSDPRAVDNRGSTALILALANDHPGVARKLLPVSDPRQRDGYNQDALMVAVNYGMVALLPALLRVCDPRAQDKGGYTPLMIAARRGGSSIASLLIPLSDLEARSAGGMRAIDIAAACANEAIVRKLLRGSRHDATDNRGSDALMHAADNVRGLECVRLLLPFFDPLRANDKGWTALAFAACRGLDLATELLLPRSDVNARIGANRRGARPDELASRHGHSEVAARIRAWREALALRDVVAKSAAKQAKASGRKTVAEPDRSPESLRVGGAVAPGGPDTPSGSGAPGASGAPNAPPLRARRPRAL
jgi:ankyrin repeat protein